MDSLKLFSFVCCHKSPYFEMLESKVVAVENTGDTELMGSVGHSLDKNEL